MQLKLHSTRLHLPENRVFTRHGSFDETSLQFKNNKHNITIPAINMTVVTVVTVVSLGLHRSVCAMQWFSERTQLIHFTWFDGTGGRPAKHRCRAPIVSRPIR